MDKLFFLPSVVWLDLLFPKALDFSSGLICSYYRPIMTTFKNIYVFGLI